MDVRTPIFPSSWLHSFQLLLKIIYLTDQSVNFQFSNILSYFKLICQVLFNFCCHLRLFAFIICFSNIIFDCCLSLWTSGVHNEWECFWLVTKGSWVSRERVRICVVASSWKWVAAAQALSVIPFRAQIGNIFTVVFVFNTQVLVIGLNLFISKIVSNINFLGWVKLVIARYSWGSFACEEKADGCKCESLHIIHFNYYKK